MHIFIFQKSRDHRLCFLSQPGPGVDFPFAILKFQHKDTKAQIKECMG